MDDGKPVFNEQGELVRTRAFPSMPVYFWNDPDGQKFINAYFNIFKIPGRMVIISKLTVMEVFKYMDDLMQH